MKVTLDLTRLLHDGAITQAEHDRLAQFGHRETGQVFINILVGFGVIAVTAGALAMIPNVAFGAVLGAILLAAGIVIGQGGPMRWALLSTICTLIGALLLGAGIILYTQGVTGIDGADHPVLLGLPAASLLVAVLFAATAVLAHSALLASLTVLVLFGALGGSTFYDHASYGLAVTEPLLTVLLFTVVALAAYQLSHRVRTDWERLAIAAARTALFLVNLGFWIGSLWGDRLDFLSHPPADGLSPPVFSIAWALALIGVAIWAARVNRRWVLNLAAVFGAIHFYTQWFEHLGADPITVLGGGVLLLVFALGLRRVNRAVG